MDRCAAAGVAFLRTAIGAKGGASQIEHRDDHSVITCDNGEVVKARLVVDATGAQSQLTRRAGDADPGFQIAYGLLAEVDRYPYDEGAMLFMDFRTDYLPEHGTVLTSGQFGAEPRELSRASVGAAPTFLYAMPMGEGKDGSKRIFFEETNLVGRPPMEFDECRARLEMRLKHHGVTVLSTGEEEKCNIPMGTALPSATNRVLAVGGAAATVHAATGYQLCRGIASSIIVAAAIDRSLAQMRTSPGSFDAAAAAAAVYATLWTKECRLQRDFCIFGGEFLMQQPVSNVRGFFSGFFALPEEDWMGFLAGWPGLPDNEAHGVWYKRLMFGVRLWLLVPPAVKLQLATSAVASGGLGFFRSVLPFAQDSTFDEAQPREHQNAPVASGASA
jgi:lycopene beta-cyclase